MKLTEWSSPSVMISWGTDRDALLSNTAEIKELFSEKGPNCIIISLLN